ncbi:MAG: arylsulfatase [Gammaproteobacteria bacterium]|nr:arylsulfatase [Gammaproteobacteria bacterium]
MTNTNARNVVLATLVASVLALSGCGSKKDISTVPASAEEARRPNVLLIVADDMGYSDIGAFGGEIGTPNLDALAARGLKATNFYAAPTCSPTRSMLLTGTDNHVAGLGNMAEFLGPDQKGKPGYEGHLSERVVSIASVLRDAGYHTYMAGKWHLGEESPNRPVDRGFERDFTLMQGGGSNWSDMGYPDPAHPHLTYMRNGQVIDKLPDDHFSSAAFSDFIIESVDEQKDDGKPFFAYLSFQAVHSPFAVPDDWLDRYKGQYDKGYDVLRAERLARMKDMGLVGKDATGFPRLPTLPAWDTLTPEQRQVSARKMEVYAAMLSNMDHHIGRVLDHLRANGQLDNTLVIFISDNGAEPLELLELAAKVDPGMKTWLEKNWDTRPESCGRKLSICDYGAAWAQVGSVPFRMFKGQVAEGGIRVPLIVAGPGVKHQGDVSDAVLHATDLMPTLLKVAGATHPSQQAGSTLAPITGKSWVPLLGDDVKAVRTEQDWIGWELFGNRAVHQGDWKLLYLLKGAGGPGEWQLFNLRNDPAELRDLSKEQPERVKAMLALWDEYVKTNGVILTGDGPFASGQ